MRASESAAVEPAMVQIPAGAFQMGATDGDKFATLLERPSHRVSFARPFALAAMPVTFAQWDAYADACPGADRPHDAGFGRGDCPW